MLRKAIESAKQDVETWIHSVAFEGGEPPEEAWENYYWAWVGALEQQDLKERTVRAEAAKCKAVKEAYRLTFLEKAWW
jgi:hypothetical protein